MPRYELTVQGASSTLSQICTQLNSLGGCFSLYSVCICRLRSHVKLFLKNLWNNRNRNSQLAKFRNTWGWASNLNRTSRFLPISPDCLISANIRAMYANMHVFHLFLLHLSNQLQWLQSTFSCTWAKVKIFLFKWISNASKSASHRLQSRKMLFMKYTQSPIIR